MELSSRSTLALWTVLMLAGCTMAAQQKDDLLLDAGFTRIRADTPEWAAAQHSLPPHRFAHRTVNGVPMVFWSDPVVCKCIYSGTQAAYAAYRQLHAQEAAAFDESAGGPGSFAQ